MSVLKSGEFSQLGRVSVRMLRHYNATGLLKPAEVDHLSIGNHGKEIVGALLTT